MNTLLLGTGDYTPRLIDLAEPPFLLLDDGPIADAFADHFPNALPFDISQHSFNPLAGMTYKRARDFVATIYPPEGENTLTVRNGKRALARALMTNTTRLDKLKGDDEVTALMSDLLLSPVLYNVLCKPTNFFFKKPVIARLNRADIGDFDAYVLGALLIGQHKGQVIVPDGGFYLRNHHIALLRQNRLVAGVTRLADLPDEIGVNRFHTKTPVQALPEDARVLAEYAGLLPDPTRVDNDYNRFIQKATSASLS